MALTSSVNPRNLRDKFQAWVGKKVTVGLTTYHYLCGTWQGFDGYYAVFRIGGRAQRVALHEIDTVSDAPSAQAEFFK